MSYADYDINDPRIVKAAIDSGLAAEHANDPALLRFYMRKLLKSGWSGPRSPEEIKYTSAVRRAFGKGMSKERIEAFRKRIALPGSQKPR